MPKNRLQAITLGTFNAAALAAAYKPIYAGGLPHALALLRITNKSNVDIIISYDGITDNDYITIDSTFFLPAQMNAQPQNQVMYIPAGTMLSVKQATVPGIGTIYISGYYTE